MADNDFNSWLFWIVPELLKNNVIHLISKNMFFFKKYLWYYFLI